MNTRIEQLEARVSAIETVGVSAITLLAGLKDVLYDAIADMQKFSSTISANMPDVHNPTIPGPIIPPPGGPVPPVPVPKVPA
jgi:hypothetical protein